MKCCTEDKACVRLCPVSFGLALGIVSGVVVFLTYLWMMYQGVPEELAGRIAELTLSSGIFHALWAFVKGLVFGFLLAVVYDFFMAKCKQWCVTWCKDKKKDQ